jgi:hypothetical protein
MNQQDMKKQLYIPATAGGITAGTALFLIKDFKVSLMLGGSVAAGSVAASLVHDRVLEKIAGNSDAAAKAQYSLLAPALTGLLAVGAASAIVRVPDLKGAGVLFAIGSGSQIVASYANNAASTYDEDSY